MKAEYKFLLMFLFLFPCAFLHAETKSQLEFKDGVYFSKTTNSPFTGVVFDFYSNGEMKSSESYKNGLNDGPLIVWNKDGKKVTEYNYKEGKRHGKLTKWFKNGNKMFELQFKDGKSSAPHIYFYPAGEKRDEMTYCENGDCYVKTWDKNGKLIAEGKYHLGKKIDGTFWLYEYEPIIIEKYINGELISAFDIEGKEADLSRTPKKTKKQMIDEGLIIETIIAEFE